jgi:hypothetical protein
MKKLTFIFVFALLSSVLFAQDKDYKGHVIDKKGDIYFDGVKVGVITKENIIKNSKGEKLAFIDANGSLIDAKGKTMGKVGKDGKTYHNANGEIMFTVKDNGETCDILDKDGKKIGNIHADYKKNACAIHCFMDGHTHKK